MKTVEPQVTLLAWTHFDADGAAKVMDGWTTDAEGGQALAEAAGRSCYQSFQKPNPSTATNAGYLRHILEVGHLSVLEHGSATFYLTGVSRSFTHELVRHRHLSYSQLSQRYVDSADVATIVPPLFAGDDEAEGILRHTMNVVLAAYGELTDRAEKLLDHRDLSKTDRRKQARQAARAVLPNATETRIVVTGNYRAWRHFLDMRATVHADVEIRAVAIAILRGLQGVAPNVFADYSIARLDDGTEVAASRNDKENPS